MKLYLYDHCPYCVRARMIFGVRGIACEEIYLPNDDEATPIGLIGQKMLPILVKEDGTAMGESLDIVAYIGEVCGETLPENVRGAIQNWPEKVRTCQNRLVMPRCVQIGLEEFATPEAVAYFTRKKTGYIGDFAENLRNSAEYIAQLEQDLAALEPLVADSGSLNGTFGMEDILVFPILRNLTMVKGVHWPAKIRAYLERMSAAARVPLYFDKAV